MKYCELTGETLSNEKSNSPPKEIVKDNETYIVEDYKVLKNLTGSKTILHRHKSTRGHKHPSSEIDEYYIFISGLGMIEIDGEITHVVPGSIVAINGNQFHKVHNYGDCDLVFVSVFNPYER